MSSPLESNDRDALLDDILDRAAAAARSGEPGTIEGWIGRYPELEADLRALLPAVMRLEGSTPDGRGHGGRVGSVSIAPGTLLGDYRLLREVGRGGMGVVYEAEQLSLARRVAIKVLPTGVRDVESLRRRFEIEARAVAKLQHPHIVTVHGLGEANGLHFYAMNFIAGTHLGEVIAAMRSGDDAPCGSLASRLAAALRAGEIDGRPRRDGSSTSSIGPSSPVANDPPSGRTRTPRDAGSSSDESSTASRTRDSFRGIGRVIETVADALAHAHAAGVIHRDVKPSNLLLDPQGKVWVADFGLAKLETDENLTQTGDAVGTLRYMGPERFRGWSDPRSDVYSLGATLYELLTLRPPHVASDRASLVQAILDDAVTPPRLVDAAIPRDLETISLKCLEKEPSRRYARAEELRDDLARWLAGQPILARRSTRLERAWSFSRRNPLLAGLAVTLFIVAVAATWSALRLRSTSSDLQATADELAGERNRALDNLGEAWLARARWSARDPLLRKGVLGTLAEAARRRPSIALRDAAIPWVATVGLDVEWELELDQVAVLHPSGDRILVSRDDGLEIRGLDGSESFTVPGRVRKEAWLMECAPDGRYVACASRSQWEIFDVVSRRSALVVPIGRLSFHPRLPRVATTDPTGLSLWDLESGARLETPAWAKGAGWLYFGPKGERAAVISADRRRATIIDTSTQRVMRTLDSPPNRFGDGFLFVVFSPAGDVIATGPRPLVVWDLETGERRLEHPEFYFVSAAFSPSGDLLVGSSWSGNSRSMLFDLVGRRLIAPLGFDVSGFRSDGAALLARTRSGRSLESLAISRPFARTVIGPVDASVRTANPAALHEDGRWLAIGRDGGTVIFDLRTGRVGTRVPQQAATVAWRASPRELVVAGPNGVWLWPWRERDGRVDLGPPRCPEHRAVHGGATVSATGTIAFPVEGVVRVIHPDHPGSDFTLALDFSDAGTPSFSRDGRFLSICDNRGGSRICVWDLETRSIVWQRSAPGARDAVFCGDERLALVSEGRIEFIEVGTWREHDAALPGFRVAASPDGRMLAVVGPEPGSVQVYAVGRRLERLFEVEISRDTPVHAVSFGGASPCLIAGEIQGGSVHVWHLDGLRAGLRPLGLDWELPFEPDAGQPARSAGHVEVVVHPPESKETPVLSIGHLALALGPWPRSVDERLRRAERAAGTGHWEFALAEGEAIVRSAPTPLARNALAWWYATAPVAHRRPERALELIQQALAAEPGEPIYQNTLGVVQCRRAAWPEALSALERSLESTRGTVYAAFDYYPMALALHGAGDARAARLAFDAARGVVERFGVETADLRVELRALDAEAAAAIGETSAPPGGLTKEP